MFQEDIAQLTADHLRTHIRGYLDTVNASYAPTKKITLVMPKDIIVASQIGGLIVEANEVLPQYGIDILGKQIGGTFEDLILYSYNGQINGLVNSTSQQGADTLVKRHARAVEHFVRDHKFLHFENNDNFRIMEVQWLGMEVSGAEPIGLGPDRELWVAGFSHDVVWVTSEDDMAQHVT